MTEAATETAAAPAPAVERFTPDETIARQRNRQLMVVSAIIVVLAGLIALTRMGRSTDAPLSEVLLVGGTQGSPAFEAIEVVRIEIYRGGDQPMVILRDEFGWRLPSRMDAPADSRTVSTLLDRITKATRLSRPSTTTASIYERFGLDEAQAVHLRLVGDNGKELLHIMVGQAEAGGRDFVRLLGESAPDGVFELTTLGGSFESVYNALNIGTDGKPSARGWVSTAEFAPLPEKAIVHEITIRDGSRSMTFARQPGSAADWRMTSPHSSAADAGVLSGLLDSLTYYGATDVAGRDTDATRLKVAVPEREIRVRCSIGDEMQTRHIYFGEKNDRREIAVWVKAPDTGTFIYWAGDHVLSRVFRAKGSFLTKSRITPVPDGVDVEHVIANDNGVLTELQREKTGSVITWRLLSPLAAEADRAAVANLLTTINTMTGYRVDGEFDTAALGVGVGVSVRSLTLRYPQRGGSDRDGDDGVPDAPDPESTPEPAKPAGPPLTTAQLYFGRESSGEVPVLRNVDGIETLFWVSAEVVKRLFAAPAEYARSTALSIPRDGLNIEEIQLASGDALTHVLKEPGPDGRKVWQLKSPTEEPADGAEINMLLAEIGMLQGVQEADLNREALKLGPGLSTRFITMRLQKDETAAVAALYFGEPRFGLTSALLVHSGEEKLFLIRPQAVDALFEHVFKDYDVKVRHILVSWVGKFEGANPKDPNRTESQARELAKRILDRAKGGEDFIALQQEFNEDGDPTAVYDVSPRAGLVAPFKRLSSELEVGEVGIVETRFGLHVIKRIE